MEPDNQSIPQMEIYRKSVDSKAQYDEIRDEVIRGLQDLVEGISPNQIWLSRGTGDSTAPQTGNLYNYGSLGVIALISHYSCSSLSREFRGGGFEVKALPSSQDNTLSKKLSELMNACEFTQLEPHDEEYASEAEHI
jgi:hypothetical protein